MAAILVYYFCPKSLQDYQLYNLLYGDVRSNIKGNGIFPLQLLAECKEDDVWPALLCVIIFLHAGISPDMIDREGNTALQKASQNNGPLFNYLIHYVIDIQNNLKSALGLTPVQTPSHKNMKINRNANLYKTALKIRVNSPNDESNV